MLYATHGREAAEEEERVDEIECKVFIKLCDSRPAFDLRGAGARGRPALRGYDTEEKTAEFTLKPVETRTRCSVGRTFHRLSRGGRNRGKREQSSF